MKYCSACKSKYDDSVSFCPVDGEVLEDDPSSLVDTVLDGQYQMEALLGKGGMGAVYCARHILLGDRVAIKVLPPEVRSNAEWLRRFRREGQAARRFRHANAVTVYDLRTATDGTIYMVMEYVEGHTLDAEIKKRGRFNAADAYETLAPIMSVLDTAHEMGVVHRDLKPENIMVGNPAGNGAPMIKLLDLGIAKMREIAGSDSGGNTALTMAGQVLGTPYYMSPEQWGEIPRDQSLDIDGRADIYSLGLVFYEMLAGRRCFSGTTLHELRREHVSTPPLPLHELVPDIPRGFSDAIQRATAKDRGDRQATAKILSEELRAGLRTSSLRSSSAVGEPVGELAETVAIPGGRETNSDVNAPTILTIDGGETIAPPSQDRSTTPPAVKSPELVMAPQVSGTVVEAAESSVTIPRVAGEKAQPVLSIPPPVVLHEKPKGKSWLLLLVGGLLVLLLGVGVAGILILKSSRQQPVTDTETKNSTAEPVAPAPVGHYWLELEGRDNSASTKVAGLVPIASGQSLKMHFVFDQDGYVYIVGPGNENKATAFLTGKPLPASGLKDNKAVKGTEFSFPRGDGNNLTLDRNPGTDNFTVIFSKSPLSSPAFLNEPVTGDPLSPTQETGLKSFISSNPSKNLVTELDESNPKSPFVRVKVPANQLDGPIVFDIRIQHN